MVVPLCGERLGAAPLFDCFERFACFSQKGSFTGVGLPASHCDVDVVRINLERPRLTSRPLGCDQDCPAATKWIEHQTAAARAILYGICNHCDRFDGRMHRQLIQSACVPAANAGIIPNVCSMAAMLSQLEIVEMRCGAGLPDEDELVLGAIE